MFMRDGLHPRGETLADVSLIPMRVAPLPQVSDNQTAITWVGHATFLLHIAGLTILTDPVWSRRIPATPARWNPPGVAWEDLAHIDAVVISHNHYDHLDAPTIKRLPRTTAMFVPAGLGRWFHRRGFTEITELDWWESAKFNSLRFDFVPAHHWSRRGLWDCVRSLWGGWIFDQRIYFAGDSGYGHHFGDIAQRYPGLDIAMMPIGAYSPRWIMRSVHMDPPEAVTAVGDLGVRRMIPMHWGTFGLTPEPVLEPWREVRRAWTESGRPREDVWDMAIGESRIL